jgi:cell division protein FtsL
MAEFKNPFRDIKVEYTRSHPLTKVVVIALIVLSMAALITLRVSSIRLHREIEQMRQEAAQLEAENQVLKEKLEELGSVEGVEHIAEEELDLVDPDTIVIVPNP